VVARRTLVSDQLFITPLMITSSQWGDDGLVDNECAHVIDFALFFVLVEHFLIVGMTLPVDERLHVTTSALPKDLRLVRSFASRLIMGVDIGLEEPFPLVPGLTC
jgi:hypothetical protein